MALSLRLSKEEEILFKKFAEMNNISVSELIRQSVLERIENELDLSAYQIAVEQFNKDTKTVSLAKLEKDLKDGI